MHWMAGIEVSDITWIAGSVFKSKKAEDFGEEAIMLPTFDEIASDKRKYAESFYIQYQNTDPFSGKRMIETVRSTYVRDPESAGQTFKRAGNGRCL